MMAMRAKADIRLAERIGLWVEADRVPSWPKSGSIPVIYCRLEAEAGGASESVERIQQHLCSNQGVQFQAAKTGKRIDNLGISPNIGCIPKM